MNSCAVEVEGLRVVRGGREVLPGLDCSIRRGALTALVGPSGCGKSTLLRSMVGVQVVTQGRVTVLGEAAGSRALRGRIGYATQSPAVYADLSVRDNLRYFAAILHAGAPAIDLVLEQVGLRSEGDRLVSQLSGGQLSRTSLAVALLNQPELLILDEPTIGLDPVLREELWRLFHQLAGDLGATLIVSSHIMDEAARCDQLLMMRDGSILADDSPEGVRRSTGSQDLEQAFMQLAGETGAAVETPA